MKNNSFFDGSNITVNPNMKVYKNSSARKMALAIEFIKENGLPPSVERTKSRKKPPRTPLQNELLKIYAITPSEQEMQQVKDFLAQLFADKITPAKAKEAVVA
jgi:arsenate reductase-like glutaredoxin family protein